MGARNAGIATLLTTEDQNATPIQKTQPAPSEQAGAQAELIAYLQAQLSRQRVIVVQDSDQTLVNSLRMAGMNAWTIEEADAGANYDTLVCLNIQREPSDSLASLILACRVVLMAWETPAILAGDASPASQAAWFSWFAGQGFYPDPALRPQLTGYQTVFLSKSPAQSTESLAARYEKILWQLSAENRARRALLNEMRDELSINGFDTAELQVRSNEKIRRSQETIDQLRGEKDDLYRAYMEIYNSESWQMMRRLHRIRHWFIPPGSRREQLMGSFFGGLAVLRSEGFSTVARRAYRQVSWRMHSRLQQKRFQSPAYLQSQSFAVPPVAEHLPPGAHTAQIDVIICVHNALEDVKRCLQSVVAHSNQPYRLILVDDGSLDETGDYLAEFARKHECTLLCNETARGYTLAANQGLRAAQGDFCVLLNSDTIVTSGWLDRMAACALSDAKIGVVGPLSNTASWQSIPKISEDGDWATNPLPPNMTVEEMGALVVAGAARLYPEMKFLNGFCLFIRKSVLDQIGLFDEEQFGAGYGEEDDFCLRARAAGWKLALADDVFIFHAQSKSYSTERRQQLYARAGQKLREKHGEQIIQAGVDFNQNDPVLQGIRARSQVLFARQQMIADGKRAFASKRVLFLLPIMVAGGGGNVIISEALAMRKMGVDVRIFNLPEYRPGFEQSYPELEIPVVYATREELPYLCGGYDAVIATINTSVAWLQEIAATQPQVRLGYYVQGFEPLMYTEDSPNYQAALQSYTLVPGAALFCKTAWTQQQVQKHTGATCQIVEPSVDIDLYRPRPPIWLEQTNPPVRIAAMVRASSPYRSPQQTMEVLQKAGWRYGPEVDILLFGIDPKDPEFSKLPIEFAWRATGLLSQRQVARLMNEIDIFVDFSQHQAMGLSALEAMACGAAVIVPQNGGAVEIVREGENGLVVDTRSVAACWQALQRLIDDKSLRRRIRNQALQDICQYYPEQSAYNILKALFDV